MTPLEQQIEDLRNQLNMVAERVRLDVVASEFLAQAEVFREGDYFLLNHDFPTKLYGISSGGKWHYQDQHGRSIEPGRIPQPGDHARLYTKAEVAEIVAKAVAKAKGSP